MEKAIASVKDLPSGQMIGVDDNGKSMLIANVNGQFYAIGNTCTHMGCSLSNGTLEGVNVHCPCHGSTFDVRTGAVVQGPATNPEPYFKLKVTGDQIMADL